MPWMGLGDGLEGGRCLFGFRIPRRLEGRDGMSCHERGGWMEDGKEGTTILIFPSKYFFDSSTSLAEERCK